MVRVQSLRQRATRADNASLCHPVHKPAANTRNTTIAVTRRLLSDWSSRSKDSLVRHLLQSGTITKTHARMANAATARWLMAGFNSLKNRTWITPPSKTAEILMIIHSSHRARLRPVRRSRMTQQKATPASLRDALRAGSGKNEQVCSESLFPSLASAKPSAERLFRRDPAATHFLHGDRWPQFR